MEVLIESVSFYLINSWNHVFIPIMHVKIDDVSMFRTNTYKNPPRVILVVKAHANTYFKSKIMFLLWLHGKKARREGRQKIKKGVARVCMGEGEGGPLLFCAAGALLALKSPGISSYTRYTVYSSVFMDTLFRT